MGKKHLRQRGPEPRSFEASRTIDVGDAQAMHFWSKRLGVTEEEIAQAVKEVGPNTTAVALKLEAPQEERIAPPSPQLR
jgi:hypothetical protein